MATSTIQQVMNNSGSGYCKMPDGTLIQYGNVSLPRDINTSTKDITFPIPFISNSSIAIITSVNTEIYADRLNSSYANASNTGCRIVLYNSIPVTGSGNGVVSWVAIGRWK